jgi:hypothetical protein
MIVISPLAVKLLADLAEHGIDLEVLGDAIRFRPRSAMTPALLQGMRTHKAELLRVLDATVLVGELRQSVERPWKDPAWQSAWERRFQAGRFAGFASLRSVLELVISQAEEYHRRHDWRAFLSTGRYLHRLASGEFWDQAEQTAAKFH